MQRSQAPRSLEAGPVPARQADPRRFRLRLQKAARRLRAPERLLFRASLNPELKPGTARKLQAAGTLSCCAGRSIGLTSEEALLFQPESTQPTA